MAAATTVSALGLAALIALPGAHLAPGQSAKAAGEVVAGADGLHVDLEAHTDQERAEPGDRIRYTVRVRNSGTEALPDARVVQFLPSTMRYVSGTGGADVEEGRVTWSRSLDPGERTSMRVTGEVTGVRDGGEHPVTTVCARPGPEAVLVSCDAALHRVHGALPLVCVVTALAFAASVALCVGGLVRHRSTLDQQPGGPGAVSERESAPKPAPAPVREPAPVAVAEPAPRPAPEPERVPETVTGPVPVPGAGASRERVAELDGRT
ncbi:putative repeat protein (TIGR01451 family) [Nocardiopsis arvandica]|uniref:Putative repeat protein (TIGR01451 family) n=1 Tax=Nocardiopsis sinuspersici TaxID=501010 RepID=A0A7Y9X873_9ACTN|nr:DUF11 domain-containing protein [Nocardiopsis sinuspersici]NYH50849.1 putative repeat protein (TIGR01451 family) [Nocardiopsis sinuspersici]